MVSILWSAFVLALGVNEGIQFVKRLIVHGAVSRNYATGSIHGRNPTFGDLPANGDRVSTSGICLGQWWQADLIQDLQKQVR
jgi:hypothetical protein